MFNLSLLGVGFTKKQAKRCAAENLISEMKSQGININPSKSPTSSVSCFAVITCLNMLECEHPTVQYSTVQYSTVR